MDLELLPHYQNRILLDDVLKEWGVFCAPPRDFPTHPDPLKAPFEPNAGLHISMLPAGTDLVMSIRTAIKSYFGAAPKQKQKVRRNVFADLLDSAIELDSAQYPYDTGKLREFVPRSPLVTISQGLKNDTPLMDLQDAIADCYRMLPERVLFLDHNHRVWWETRRTIFSVGALAGQLDGEAFRKMADRYPTRMDRCEFWAKVAGSFLRHVGQTA